MMIDWKLREKIKRELFCAVLSITIVPSYRHTHMNSFFSALSFLQCLTMLVRHGVLSHL